MGFMGDVGFCCVEYARRDTRRWMGFIARFASMININGGVKFF